MKELLEGSVPNYQKHSKIFQALGPMGYTVALNVRNVTPELYYSTFPAKWTERYTKQSFMMADPVVDFMFMGQGVVRWSEIKHSRGDQKTQQFLEISGQENLNFGAAVVRPSAKDPTIKSLVSVCRHDRELTDNELNMLDASFQELLIKLEVGVQLTHRQTQVLFLMSKGATRNKCALELNVSPETIKRDVEIARKILGAKNLTEAVAIATARRIIFPTDAQVW